jgi:hypothetical protein
MSSGVLAAWTWEQLAHEAGTFAAWLIAVLSLIHLVKRAASLVRTRDDELRDTGHAVGLNRAQTGTGQKSRRFSVLDVFAVITLFAAFAGLIKGVWNGEEKGIPRADIWPEIRQHDK